LQNARLDTPRPSPRTGPAQIQKHGNAPPVVKSRVIDQRGALDLHEKTQIEPVRDLIKRPRPGIDRPLQNLHLFFLQARIQDQHHVKLNPLDL
jgi:hypothetical protein